MMNREQRTENEELQTTEGGVPPLVFSFLILCSLFSVHHCLLLSRHDCECPMRRPLPPTIEQTQAIASYIRAGGYPHVAAEAAGVSVEVFDSWLRMGRAPRVGLALRQFYEAVRQARAHARIKAEMVAFKERPLEWLKSGPGKETAESAGWTGTIKPQPGAAEDDFNPLAHPELQEVFHRLLLALAPFPEARAAAALVLTQPSEDDGLARAGAD
jgi:hypothetical protein